MIKFFLSPFSFIYATIAGIRNFLYDYNFVKSYYFHQISVISIGNLAVGGTGKTPMTEYLLKSLKQKKIAVLSRGYKRTTKGYQIVTPNKHPNEVGDEPLQMALKFPNNTFAVCENRVTGINKLISEKNIDVIILDDAFQHRKVKPKLSILLTEYNRPFFNDNFLPVGKLRDNKNEYHRADIIVVTKSPKQLLPIEKNIWRDNIKLRPYQKLFFSTIKYGKIINIFDLKKTKEPKSIKNIHLIVFSGIANHEYFINYISNEITKNYSFLKFSDHQNYSQKKINEILAEFDKIKDKNKIILTTEKDAVKIRTMKIDSKYTDYFYYQTIETKILFDKEEEEFNKLIRKALV